MKKISFIVITIALLVFATVYFARNSESVSNTDDIKVNDVKFSPSYFSAGVTISNNTNTENTYRVTSIPYNKDIVNLPYYFYADTSYPIVGASTITALGVVDHLQSELKGKEVSESVTTVDAKRLSTIMRQGPAVVIITTGVLPDTVLSDSEDLVGAWLRKGGCIIWAGDAFGYYYGKPNESLKKITSTALGWASQEKILGTNILSSENYNTNMSETLGNTPCKVAEALSIRYKYTQTGAIASLLRSVKGTNLGWSLTTENDVRTSLAWVPVGKGGVLIFGSGVAIREADVAWDISQIIASDIIYSDTDSVTTKNVTVPAGQTISTNIEQQNNNYWKIKMIIFNESVYEHEFFMKSYKK